MTRTILYIVLIHYPIINSIIRFICAFVILKKSQNGKYHQLVILSRFIEMHSHNQSTLTLIAQCFVRIFFSPTLFSYCGTMLCFCICKTSEEMNAFGKNIILRISGDRSHMTEFLYYDREFEFTVNSLYMHHLYMHTLFICIPQLGPELGNQCLLHTLYLHRAMIFRF